MSETALQVSLKDPLSEITRKERRMLLSISVLSAFIAKSGLVPTKIQALGIELEQGDQRAFLIVMMLVVLYFLVAFILYGVTDFLSWRLSYNEMAKASYRQFLDQMDRLSSRESNPYEEIIKSWRSTWPNRLAGPASFMRAAFEFLLPFIIGGYAIYALYSAA